MRLLTPPGIAGIAVVEVERVERDCVAACLFTRAGAPFVLRAGGPPRLAELRLQGEGVDEVLVVDRGDGGFELHTHGAPIVVERLLALTAPAHVSPLPAPWQTLARGAMDAGALELALEQREHDFAAHVQHLLSLPPRTRAAAAAATRERSRIAAAMAEPLRVVLVGEPNAGKSTLFNLLLLHERALVGALPGLTRDPVAERTSLDGYPYELTDTAGELEGAGDLDRAAVAAGRALRRGAFVVRVVDGSVGPSANDRAHGAASDAVVATKADLPQAPWPDDVRCDLRVSHADAAGLTRQRFGAWLRARRRLPAAGRVGGPAALDDTQRAMLAAV